MCFYYNIKIVFQYFSAKRKFPNNKLASWCTICQQKSSYNSRLNISSKDNQTTRAEFCRTRQLSFTSSFEKYSRMRCSLRVLLYLDI